MDSTSSDDKQCEIMQKINESAFTRKELFAKSMDNKGNWNVNVSKLNNTLNY